MSCRLFYPLSAIVVLLMPISLMTGCSQAPERPTFGQDLALLSRHHAPIVLADGPRKVIVLAELQGRAMVSTSRGDQGKSHGWINRNDLAQAERRPGAAIGGADRLSFGPETGPYSLFFEPGVKQTGENVRFQPAISTQPYQLSHRTDTEAVFSQQIQLENYQGQQLELEVKRRISLLDTKHIEKALNTQLPPGLDYVGFEAQTQITNTGHTMREETGLISLWHLGAFETSPHNTVVIPTRGQPTGVTPYFNETRASHTRVKDGVVYYRADAQYMNKIGLPPEHTVPLMGAWDPALERLTLIVFSFDPAARRYVNSTWLPGKHSAQQAPYKGDVTNVFNDGLMDDGERFGPFYELESSSPALQIARGESAHHQQTTLHFQGDRQALSKLAKATLGVSLDTIERPFAQAADTTD